MTSATLSMLLLLSLGQDLSESNFDKLREQVRPSKEELKWRELPWYPTVGEAVAVAHKAEKPVLLYAMNGHPLACV